MEKSHFAMRIVTQTARIAQSCVIAALTLFFVFPVITIASKFTQLSNLVDTLADVSLRGVWWFTFWQAALSTLLTLVVALPFTWAVSRHTFWSSRILTGLITVPFLMPAVVVAAGVKAIVPNAAVPAILWAHVVFNVAVVVRMVGPQWALLDRTLEDTAADLGAGRIRTFFYVVMPHIRSSLRNAASIVFLFCFTSFAVVAILGGISHRTIESEIFTQAVRLGDTRTATSLALLQALVVLIVVRIGGAGIGNADQSLSIQSNAETRSRLRASLFFASFVPTVIVFAPLVAVLLRSITLNGHLSFSGYQWIFDGSTEAFGINMSRTLITSLAFACICAVLATTSALIISTARNRTSIVPIITALPITISAVTIGLGLFITFNASPVNWRSRWWLIPVIHSVIALPLALRTIQPAVRSIPADLYDASASLGASPWRTWVRVELPLIRPALIRAAGFASAVSLGEFGATSFLSRSDTTTIPIAIGQLLGRPGDLPNQTAFALASLVLIAIALVPRVRLPRR